MSSTLTEPVTTATIWIAHQTWDEPTGQMLQQKVEAVAVGSPEDPANAGRRAVDRHAEDLRRLADS